MKKLNLNLQIEPMKNKIHFLILLAITFTLSCKAQVAGPDYLDSLKQELKVKWPNNRTINLVFHGHSVPTGYTTKGVLDRMHSYPLQTLKAVNDHYPYSVINTITTSIGGEQAEQGAKRMQDVFTHKPDVIFIDYALNDRGIGLERAKVAWELMIKQILEQDIKLILLTPTPDLREDITSEDTQLAMHSAQIRELAAKYKIGLVDSYALFKNLAVKTDLEGFMSQNNHINQKGHQLVSQLIFDTHFNFKQ